jgi:hypothetical protein
MSAVHVAGVHVRRAHYSCRPCPLSASVLPASALAFALAVRVGRACSGCGGWWLGDETLRLRWYSSKKTKLRKNLPNRPRAVSTLAVLSWQTKKKLLRLWLNFALEKRTSGGRTSWNWRRVVIGLGRAGYHTLYLVMWSTPNVPLGLTMCSRHMYKSIILCSILYLCVVFYIAKLGESAPSPGRGLGPGAESPIPELSGESATCSSPPSAS